MTSGHQLCVFSLNMKFGAIRQGRWPEQAAAIKATGAGVVLLQEADEIADLKARDRIRADLGMELDYALAQRPGRGHTAVAWDPNTWTHVDTDTAYSHRVHHSYTAARLRRTGHPVMPPGTGQRDDVPWVFISAHLTPFSAEVAATEAQLEIARLYRAGGLGMLCGDINHFPDLVRGVPGRPDEPDPDISRIPHYNRAARYHPRPHPSAPWIPNQTVGWKLRDGGLTDVARHLAITHHDPSYLAPTSRGGLRIDQAHTTPALTTAITGYQRISTASDHHGILITLDPGTIDTSQLLDYT